MRYVSPSLYRLHSFLITFQIFIDIFPCTHSDGGEDAVTQADIKAQQIIEGSLTNHFGKRLRIIGEENLTEFPHDMIFPVNVERDELKV